MELSLKGANYIYDDIIYKCSSSEFNHPLLLCQYNAISVCIDNLGVPKTIFFK